VDSARAELTQAELRPSPSASVEWRDQIAGPDNQLMLNVMWPLDLSRRDGRTAVAREQIASAGFVQAEHERQLAGAIWRQSAVLLAAIRQAEIRDRLWQTARDTRDLLAARVASGASPPLERDVAEVESRRAEAEFARQQAAVDVAAAELAGLIGLPPGSPVLLRDPLEVIVRRGALAGGSALAGTASVQALEARPDVRAASSQIALAAARADLLRRDARPEVSVTGSYWRMNAGFPQFGFDASGRPAPIHDLFHSVSFGATVSVPWSNRQQGAIAAAAAEETAARHDRDARRVAAAAEIEAARARDAQARRVWAIYDGGLRDLALQNLEVVRQSHGLGGATLIQVLAETRRYLEVETASTEALLEVVNARVALATAMGVLR
jgi:outer membrane protein TolC